MATVQPIVYTHDAKSQLDEFLRVICEQLQLPPYRYQLADQRYGTVPVRTSSLAGHFQFFQHVTGIFILRIEIE